MALLKGQQLVSLPTGDLNYVYGVAAANFVTPVFSLITGVL